tara:strand:- start:133 stop:1371 length:1239 start_codon:yes stop_codon:yes gene_type:complete
MDKDQILDQIFNDDPLGLLTVKAKQSSARTPDERLLASFQEINDFIEKNGKEPEANPASVSEFQLYSRLKSLKTDSIKVEMLKGNDIHNVLPAIETDQVNERAPEYKRISKKVSSIEDILEDDSLDILGGDDADLFKFKHTPKDDERASAEFVARRKPCKDFDKYESTFKSVQQDLANGKRKLIPFKQENLRPGDYYVHNGVLLFLEHVDFEEGELEYKSGNRVRKDGRTRTIFENGTESKMLYRSLYKAILANGKSVTQNFEKVNEGFIEEFSSITDQDEEAGYIYVLKSKSKDERITSIRDLYKIGYATNIEERLKGAEKQPTYLMAPVDYVAGWKCFNMNPQKFEQLIHNFFGNSCLEVDVFDGNGKRYTPREWFIAPIEVIEQAIVLIINGKITKYKYDAENKTITER